MTATSDPSRGQEEGHDMATSLDCPQAAFLATAAREHSYPTSGHRRPGVDRADNLCRSGRLGHRARGPGCGDLLMEQASPASYLERYLDPFRDLLRRDDVVEITL